jgi:SAM-dependent methyltransferase
MNINAKMKPEQIFEGQQLTNRNDCLYNSAFFEMITEGALQSAQIIVPLVSRLVGPKSVIDIGCGYGAWLKVFQEHGVKRVRGLDGRHIDLSKLLIDRIYFSPVDLAERFQVSERYDLAVCLEVAEHLPQSAAPQLIRTLTTFAPFVLFSAAVPGQKGTGHVNEQWPSYWKSLFAENGFRRLDPIRRHIWKDNRIQWFYRQNIFLYVSQNSLTKSESLQAEERLAELDVTYIECLNRYRTLKGVLGELPRVINDAIRRRIGLQRS